jgi:predicted DNA-binding protein YlxM (UPF0122 family)
MDAWENENVRQKPIMDDVKEFVEEYEAKLKIYEEENKVPKEESA